MKADVLEVKIKGKIHAPGMASFLKRPRDGYLVVVQPDKGLMPVKSADAAIYQRVFKSVPKPHNHLLLKFSHSKLHIMKN